jgi:DNA uptake protein ComE-like DNA-binding protein
LVGSALACLAVLMGFGPPAAAVISTASAAASAAAPAGHPVATPKSKAASAGPATLVDINSAGRKELKTLPGIGDAEANKIIANRPYLSKTELVSKNVLPVGPYLELKNRIIAMQKNTRKVTAP